MPRGYRNNGLPVSSLPQRMDEESSAQYITPIVELRALPRLDHKDIDAIEERIDYFFQFCMERNLRPGVAMLAASLGVTEATLRLWERTGGRRGEDISMAKEQINAILEQLALNNKVNPTTVIWFQKNHFGYQDNVPVEERHSTSLDALPSKEDIMKRLPMDDDDTVEDAEFREVDDDGEESIDTDGAE